MATLLIREARTQSQSESIARIAAGSMRLAREARRKAPWWWRFAQAARRLTGRK